MRLPGGVIASAGLHELRSMLRETRLSVPVDEPREVQLVEALRARREHLGRMEATHALIRRLAAEGARFIIVGGVAMRFHVPERQPPSDFDLLLEPTAAAGRALITAFERLGAPPVLAVPRDFERPWVQARERTAFAVDVLTPPAAVDFAHHWALATEATMAGTVVRIASAKTMRVLLGMAAELMPERAEDFARDLNLLEGK